MITMQLRFYEELNDFLPLKKRKIRFPHTITQQSTIKDVIESLGVPHTEIELILVNGKPVDFNYLVQEQDDISVYPVFEAFDVSELVRLRSKPLRKPRFILDVHLGKLARYMRLLGLDVVYETDLSDETIVQRSKEEKRIVLTRDIGLLKNKAVTHGHWMHHTDPNEQVKEVLKQFHLTKQCHPFTRCLRCNGLLKKVNKNQIITELPPLAQKYYQSFMQCQACKKIYWEGSHYNKLKNWLAKIQFNSHIQ